MDKFDVVIAGGGMVGALAANLLAEQGLSVLVLDRFDISTCVSATTPHLRTSAFNRFSVAMLQSLDVWKYIDENRRAPYRGLQTWEDPRYPLEFDCGEINQQYLGYILENNLVQQALWKNFGKLNIELRCPASIESYSQNSVDDGIEITLDNGERITTTLLVGADGAQSKVRQLANIGTDGWQYAQQCLAINVQMSEPFEPITWQQFHPSGPRAFLPLYEQYASLIWYDHSDRVAQLVKLSESQLKSEIEQAFPARLGDFTIIDKAAFPLTRMHAKSYYAKGVVLIGDAAHTINPLAGQGVNLGFKDANQLSENVAQALKQGQSIADIQVLRKYHQSRYTTNLLMMSAMDMCYLGFSNDIKPLAKLRNLGLALANKAGPLKKQVLKYAVY
jgi:2-octaprenyl-3-methyl-6-methoxy-1,4-benzoquinol hydroxylase